MPFRRWEILPAVLTLAGVSAWAVPALVSARGLDFGMAYRGGEAAWADGHPEAVHTWMSTPVLAVVMALVSRAAPLVVAVRVHTAVNIALAAGLAFGAWRDLRATLPRAAWWATLIGAAFFSPLVSTVAYKQFNLIALALACLGFALVRGGRAGVGGGFVAGSIAIKPVAILVIPALLVRRDTRSAGAWAVAWLLVLTGAAQAFLALRAGDPGVLAPQRALAQYAQRSSPWVMQSGNYAPFGLLCRQGGLAAAAAGWLFERCAAAVFVVVLAALANDAIRDRPGRSWDAFAFACLLSPMVGPVAWSHYQLLLAPMFLVLACRFARTGARWPFWMLLAGAYALAELALAPLGTAPGLARRALTGAAETPIDVVRVDAAAQFAQYVLFVAAWAWWGAAERPRP